MPLLAAIIAFTVALTPFCASIVFKILPLDAHIKFVTSSYTPNPLSTDVKVAFAEKLKI